MTSNQQTSPKLQQLLSDLATARSAYEGSVTERDRHHNRAWILRLADEIEAERARLAGGADVTANTNKRIRATEPTDQEIRDDEERELAEDLERARQEALSIEQGILAEERP